MATANLAERLEIDGVPLSTPAWELEDISPLWDVPEYRGTDYAVPFRRGVLAFRRQWGGKRASLPLAVVGAVDSDGNPAAAGQERVQLWANRNELVRDVFAPVLLLSTTGDRTVRYYDPAGNTWSGPGKVLGGLRPTPVGPAALRGNLELLLSEGGLRSDTPVDVTSGAAPGGGSLDFTVPNPDATDLQDALQLHLTGAFTSVKLSNISAAPGGEIFLEFGGGQGVAGVDIDTGLFTAVRDSVNVLGLITDGGFERWLPLVPGNNTIRIEPIGGDATVRFQHRPFLA